MKFLKYLIIFLAAACASLVTIGLLNPSVSYESTVLVSKPVAHSFSVFSNPFNLKKWLPGFKSMSTLSGVPNQVGSKYELIFEEGGKEMVMTEEITGFERNSLFAFELTNDVLTSEVKITFEDEDGKTRITASTEVEGHSFVFRSLFPFMKASFQKRDEEAYQQLKQLIEESDYENMLLIDFFLNRG